MSETNVSAGTGLPDPKPSTPPTGLPVLPPVAALLEVLLLVVVPGTLDYVFPWFPNLNETQPHFFWLPVLLLTLQYGTPSGLLAAAAAILLTSVLGWPEQEIGENHFTYLLRIWLQPMLWIGTAVVLGQLRLRQIESRDALARQVATLLTQRQAIADHARNLRARCDQLERVMTTTEAPQAAAVLAALGDATSSEPHAARPAFERALALAFGVASASLYALGADGSLRFVTRFPANGRPGSEPIESGSALALALIHEQRGLCVMTPGDEQTLAGRAIAAAPVVEGDRRANGALLLEAASASAVDAATASRLMAFAALLPAAGTLARSSTQQAAQPPAMAASSVPAGRAWRRLRREAVIAAAAPKASSQSGRS